MIGFLGEGYLESLAEAWEYIVETKKKALGKADLDEEKLVRGILHEDEPLDLVVARLRYLDILAPSRRGKNIAESLESNPKGPPTLQTAGASVSLSLG